MINTQKFEPQVIQCQNTKVCNNNKCFWRQRDVFGLSPFFDLDPKHIKKQEEIRNKYGESYFPEWKVSVGTNCIYVTCKDRK